MRRFVVVAAAALMVGTLAVGTVAAVGNTWKAPPFSAIGINNIYNIGDTYGEGGPDSQVLRVWMETGSQTEKCLATMGEANHAPVVDGFYCSSRLIDLGDGRDHWGVMVTLILPAPLTEYNDPDPAWYSLNVYQEGARLYGPPTPVECLTDGPCTLHES